MLVLRVRCVDDGRELLVERHGADEHSVQVAELKQLILQRRQQRVAGIGTAAVRSDSQPPDLDDCFVLLRGQILADPDVVDLNALLPSDFFVFAADVPQSDIGSKSFSSSNPADSAAFKLLRSQLVDMGFSTELAAQALRQSSNNLSDAAALLADRKVSALSGTDSWMDSQTTDLTLDPSLAPLRSLVNDVNVRKLRQLAATDTFQALLLLKEQFSSEMLTQLNENPVATLRLLSLPAPAPSSTAAETEQYFEDAVGVDDGVSMEATNSDAKDTIDRLVAMGFARDLVEVMYESCGGDEQVTANALLQTLES